MQDCLSRFLDSEAQGSDGALQELVLNVEGLQAWVQNGQGDRPSLGPLKNLLEYAAFFFDGDGCVTNAGSKTMNTLELSVAQSSQSADILVLFAVLLGGSVSAKSSQTGTAKALLHWRVSEAAAARAAEDLRKGRWPRQG